MKCIICHGDNIQLTAIQEGLKIENDLVYVPVCIPICRNCGERYYDRRTMRFLEQIHQTLRKEKQMNLQEIGKILLYGGDRSLSLEAQ
ncbi:MAG: hypothetical protein AB7S75_00765 [Desulfococcaceae bacterium]